jgi:integrase
MTSHCASVKTTSRVTPNTLTDHRPHIKETRPNRVVPLAPWLADDLRDYLANMHPFSQSDTQGNKFIPHVPLFPGRRSRTEFIGPNPLWWTTCTTTTFNPPVRQ